MKRRPAHTPPFLSPTAYGCTSAVLGAGLYLAAVQTGSDACMAGALAIPLSHIRLLWRGAVRVFGREMAR